MTIRYLVCYNYIRPTLVDCILNEEVRWGDDMNFFQFEEFFVLQVLFLFSIYVCYRGFRWMSRSLDLWLRRNRIKYMISILRKHGPMFRYNIDRKVLGLCSEKGFKDAEREFLKKPDSHFEKMLLKVNPTLTFSMDLGSHRQVHTGYQYQLEDIMHQLIVRLTHKSTRGLNPKELEELYAVIMIKDSRLFVPYTGTASEAKEQSSLCGQPTISFAQAMMLK